MGGGGGVRKWSKSAFNFVANTFQTAYGFLCHFQCFKYSVGKDRHHDSVGKDRSLSCHQERETERDREREGESGGGAGGGGGGGGAGL